MYNYTTLPEVLILQLPWLTYHTGHISFNKLSHNLQQHMDGLNLDKNKWIFCKMKQLSIFITLKDHRPYSKLTFQCNWQLNNKNLLANPPWESSKQGPRHHKHKTSMCHSSTYEVGESTWAPVQQHILEHSNQLLNLHLLWAPCLTCSLRAG